MMSTQVLLQRLRPVRLLRIQFAYSRSYVAPARTPTPRSVPLPKSQFAKSSTKAESNSEPEIAETFPNTPAETNSTPEVVSPALFEQAIATGPTMTDWSRSYQGLSTHAFSKDVAEVLLAPIDPLDIEMKPGILVASLELAFKFKFEQMV